MPERSPLAPDSFPDIPAIPGVRLSSAACGFKKGRRSDLALWALDPGTVIAGVLTRSLTASAPVLWCRKALARGKARAIIVNAGNSNAFTGMHGQEAVDRTVAAVARRLGCPKTQVFTASTGVIGEPLDDSRITGALDDVADSLGETDWPGVADAIRTTDTFCKGAVRTAEIGGVPVTIAGVCKGSGMIAPDMATMLAFIFTDARIPQEVLQAMLGRANDRSFNSITVDGDTSTSDTVLLCATGKARHTKVARAGDPVLRAFRAALEDVMVDLAQQIVRDGEGASKFVTIRVTGAKSARAARRIGLSIANSPLVKTAIAGEDANWGRIVMAVGKSGEAADRDRLEISIGGVKITNAGMRVQDYDEGPVAAHMKGKEIDIDVDIGLGRGKATVWTCDLTHGYITINADYRS